MIMAFNTDEERNRELEDFKRFFAGREGGPAIRSFILADAGMRRRLEEVARRIQAEPDACR